jgi:hypothetical protein
MTVLLLGIPALVGGSTLAGVAARERAVLPGVLAACAMGGAIAGLATGAAVAGGLALTALCIGSALYGLGRLSERLLADEDGSRSR